MIARYWTRSGEGPSPRALPASSHNRGGRSRQRYAAGRQKNCGAALTGFSLVEDGAAGLRIIVGPLSADFLLFAATVEKHDGRGNHAKRHLQNKPPRTHLHTQVLSHTRNQSNGVDALEGACPSPLRTGPGMLYFANKHA